MKMICYYCAKAVLFAFILLSCANSSNSQDNPIFRKDFPGKGVIKAKYVNGHYFVLLEKLSALEQAPGDRFVELLNTKGATIYSFHSDSQSIIDADFDGETVYTSSIDYDAVTQFESIVIDKIDLIDNRTQKSVIFKEKENTDIDILGERIKIVAGKNGLYLAVFKEDWTTYLYKLNKNNLSIDWELLVEPAFVRVGVSAYGGSYDTFEQLNHRNTVYLDTDEAGNAYVGIPVMGNVSKRSIDAHNIFFGESLELKSKDTGTQQDPTDAIITKISSEGKRIYSVVMGTLYQDEIHGLSIYTNKIITYGRCRTTDLFDYWNPYITMHDTETGKELFSKNYDFGGNGNEVFLSSGYNSDTKQIYLCGTGGWTQSDSGVSVSENSQKVLLSVDAQNGSVIDSIYLKNGSRQNQVRSIQILDDNHMLLAGWENGPGTHSGDGDHSLVYADGFLEVR